MFRSRSSVSYRMGKSRVGKKLKTHTRLLVFASVLCVLIVLTVIWGLIWGDRAQQSALARAEVREQARLDAALMPDWLPTPPAPVQAAYPGRVATLDDTVAEVQLLLAQGATAISLSLYEDGAPRYDSAVAQSLGRQLPEQTDVTLSRLFGAVLAGGGSACATFTTAWQQEGDPAMRQVLAAYEAALVAEIAHSGAQEVLLLGMDLSPEQMDTAAAFLRDIRTAAPDIVIGVGVPCAVVLGDDAVGTLRTLLTWADHVALDLRDLDTATDADEALARLDPAIRAYRMRLLIPTARYELLEPIEAQGYDSWQIIR